MKVADFLAIPDLASSGYGVEVVITRAALSRHHRVRYVPLPNITHVWKESKRGLWRGFGLRLVMWAQILRCTWEDRFNQLRESVRSRG